VPDFKTLCERWSKVPANFNYLVAGGWAALSFLDCREHGLADSVEWETKPESLIQSHRPRQRISVVHTQTLRSVRKPNSNKSIRDAVYEYLDGCFVFGAARQLEKRVFWRSSEHKTEARSTLSTLHQLNKALPSLPSSASDASENSRVSLAIEPSPEDSISSSQTQNLENYSLALLPPDGRRHSSMPQSAEIRIKQELNISSQLVWKSRSQIDKQDASAQYRES
jgi:hypothetical protein